MKVQPVIRYAGPRYPTQSVLDEHPELLRMLPGRWRRNALMAAGVASCCSLLLLQAERTSSAPLARLAPIFPHGGGQTRGVVGTSFSTGPIFLPEDEARQVIADELLKAGISSQPDRPTIAGLSIPTVDPKTKKPSTVKASLTMDGENGKRQISYEYLTPGDVEALGFAKGGSLKEQGETLRTALGDSEAGGTMALFYDPCVMVTSGMFPQEQSTPGMVSCANFSNTTLIPLTFFAELEGRVMSIEQKGDTITLSCGKHTVKAVVGSELVEFDGKPAQLSCPVTAIGTTPYLPLRPIAEALGFQVEWSAKEETVALGVRGGFSRLIFPDGPNNQGEEVDYFCRSRICRQDNLDPKTAITYAFLFIDPQGCLHFAREKSKAELRLQVRDFLAWLKTEGII